MKGRKRRQEEGEEEVKIVGGYEKLENKLTSLRATNNRVDWKPFLLIEKGNNNLQLGVFNSRNNPKFTLEKKIDIFCLYIFIIVDSCIIVIIVFVYIMLFTLILLLANKTQEFEIYRTILFV